MGSGPDRGTVDGVLERAGYSCEICGSGVGDRRGVDWSVHHRKPRQMGGTKAFGINLPYNLLILCGSGNTGCHNVVESHRTASYAAGWLVRNAADPLTVNVLVCKRWVRLTGAFGYEEVQ